MEGIMKFLLILISFLLLNNLFTQPYYSCYQKNKININSISANSNIIIPENGRAESDYWIGPEIIINGATGFYDFQSRGECRHQIDRFSSTTMHAVYYSSTDSININSSRRNLYSFSDDDGATWTFISEVPAVISSYNSITSLDGGSAVISTLIHPNGSSIETDVAPGAGSFTSHYAPVNMYYGNCTRLTNNRILISGVSYHTAVTDSVVVSVFNPEFSVFNFTNKFKIDQFVNQTGMVMTQAAGPDGKALLVISPVSDFGGNLNYNRIFTLLSTNNGQTWGTPSVLYNPTVLNGEFAVPFFGLDAVFDNAGNYYVAFNTLDTNGFYSSAKLWVSKNGAAPVLAAQHSGVNGIPQAANTLLNQQTYVCTIDNPSISVSNSFNYILLTYSVTFQNDTLNGFNKSHIFLSVSNPEMTLFNTPIQVTNSGAGSFDERYSSIIKSSPNLGGIQGTTVYLVYQKDPQPGSRIIDNAPLSRASMIFRNIYSLDGLPGFIIYNGTELPFEHELSQNYPNPFNPVTQIGFKLNASAGIKLHVFDAAGKLVTELYNNPEALAGSYKTEFIGTNYPSGIYFLSLKITEKGGKVKILTRKMILVK